MSIITISRGSYSHGTQIADKLAEELGYECISREILLEASKEFNVPETTLMLAVRDGPSILDRITHRKETYISFVRTALLKHVQKDNVVYHGFAGHILLQKIPGVLKVRINAHMEDRIQSVMRRHKSTAEEARRMIHDIDESRRKWSLYFYGADPSDGSLYDMVLHTRAMSVQDAVDTIVRAVKLPAFQVTPETMESLRQLTAEGEAASL
jgi:cytidylate kinase